MKELVNYNNEINKVALKNFNSKELDLLMAICSKMKDEELKEVSFDFEYLRRLVNYDIYSTTDKFYSDLKNTYNKLLKCVFGWENEKEIVMFVLFTRYKIDKDKKTVNIAVNEDFYWVLNELTQKFTKFELSEFISLKSTYSKECYRRLKQYRNTGMWIVEIDEFRRLLDIPNSYKSGNIDQRVLKPILNELSPIFKNFRIEKIKKGKVIVLLKFSFIPEAKDITYFKSEDEAIIYAYKTSKNTKFEILFDKNKGYFAKFN